MFKLVTSCLLLTLALSLPGAAIAQEAADLPTFDASACSGEGDAAACEAATEAFLDAIEDLPEEDKQAAIVDAVVVVAEASAGGGGGGGAGGGGGGGSCGASAQSSGAAISRIGALLPDAEQADRVADIADAVSKCEPLDTEVIEELIASPA